VDRTAKRLSLGLSLAVLFSLLIAAVPASGSCGPEVDFSADPTRGEAPLKVHFTDETVIPTAEEPEKSLCEWEILWDFGDGATSRSDDPTHIYRDPGSYTVTLTYEWVCEKAGILPLSDVLGLKDPFQPLVYSTTKEFYIVVTEPRDHKPKTAEPAKMSTSYLNVDPVQVLPNQEVVVSANVCNQGGEDGSTTATLTVNGHSEQSQAVTVSGGACQQVTFRLSRAVPGQYQVTVNGMQGQFNVLAPRTVTQNVASQQDTGLGTTGLIAIIVVGIVLVLALVVVFRGT
jgi:hypothetical protein